MSDNGNIGINNSGTYVVSYWDPETKTWKYYADDELGELRRDNLKLSKINENGTISEMIKTIDENFRNIAAHGGGPAGFDGMDGINGADGTSAQYIFALCDEELEEGTHYPATDKGDLFDSVEFAGSTSFPSSTNKKIEWFDHPQGVSKEHKNEYVFSRYKRTSGENIWFYAEKPELWAHWGETGRDGDGVEYIFMRSKTKIDESALEDSIIKKKSMSGDKYQSVIYQMGGFFPGEGWFKDDKNKTNAWKVIKAKYGEDSSYSEFNTLWENKRFNMIVPDYNWTDEPKGTDPIYVYEYVAIRRCNVDDEDRKEWGDFSIPAIWSHYGLSTRTIIIYCNTEDTTSPVSPQTGQGIWNESEGKLTLPDSLVKAGWKDTNETPSENQITWMCSGIFDNSGKNVSWSKPMRITGKDGKQGEDGTTVEFIYVLSKNMPEHPDPTTTSGKIDTEKLFDDIEASKSVDRYGNTWFDRAQPISPDKPTEYVWSRRRDKESEPWEYDDEPIIWAHWGEDGTDGDGVEYIFYITNTETFDSANNPPKVSAITGTTELDKCKKLVYNMDDFYPNENWFTKNELKIKKEITDAGYSVSNYDSVKVFFSKGWSDNPIKVSPMSPYQWVSIRRSHTDETTGGKRFWEDFSDPVLWNSYGKSTRTFIVYCNVSDGVVPPTLRTPVGGFWNVDTGKLVKDEKNLTTPYTYDALASGVTDDDRKNHINIWEDNNKDVDDKIAWMSSAIFGDDGKIIGEWSAPFRITGHNGENGADGSNIEYIYALCDDEDSLKYPKNGADSAKNTFFNNVESKGTEGYPYEGTTWYDHPQGVSNEKGKRTEWVWSRSKPAGDSKTAKWEYAPSAVKWSHWGEDGTDGDGVEYIFYATTNNPLLDNQKPPKVSEITGNDNLSKCKKIIYNMREFFPNVDWFTNNKDNVSAEVVKQNIMTEEEFNTLWTNHVGDNKDYFGFNLGWTDNPSGVNFEHPFEWVSIRRTKNDPEDTSGKIWGDYSEPKIWGAYNKKTRLFMVYCNVDKNTTPDKPSESDFSWNVQTDSLVKNNPDSNWSDTNIDEPNKIAWLCSGLFSENGDVTWSEPHRITGAEGKAGADGSNMEFIYAISESMVGGTNYPTTDKDDNPNSENTKEGLFNNVESSTNDPKGYAYNETFWYDRAQPIENVAGKRTEYAWSRYRSAGTTEWTYDPKPFVWAHWGEDGTDGDGVEYIFMLSEDKFTTTLDNWNYVWKSAISDWGPYEKAIYSMDDFIPNLSWFTSNNNSKYHESKPKVKKIIEANGGTFNDGDYYNAWVKVRDRLSFNNITIGNHKMGTWYDNPQDLTPSNKYQYVSIRKMNNGEWGLFSYPKLWSKYNISSFTEFAFTATTPDVDLSTYAPTGGTFSNPTPDYDENLKLVWSDGPKPVPAEGKTIIWMTSAKFKEDDTKTPTWSNCQRMADTSTFQVEWSTDDISGNDLTNAISKLANDDYNFGKFLSLPEVGYDPEKAEEVWRYVVKNGYDPNNFDTKTPYLTNKSFKDKIAAVGLTFGDTSGDAVLMATCQEKNGKWSNWKLDRVKGEKGEAGTSINMKTPITYEVYLDDNNYTIANAITKFNAVKSTLTTPTPSKGYLAVVYPHDMDTNDIYRGDPNRGNALYMCKYNGSSWVEYYDENTVSLTDEAPGDTHPSPNGHLILWDGDSWMDVGNIVGPAGPVSVILVKYAKDSKDSTEQDKKYEFVEGDNIPNAKYVGFITYPEGSEPGAITDPNDATWHWQLFKGQDGFGYEYIFKATAANTPASNIPDIPTGDWNSTPNVVPTDLGWYDEPMEPTKELKYVWMCWRKYDHSTQKWTDFQGNSSNPGKARLWQVYANSINEVKEYFHADSSISPVSNPDYFTMKEPNPGDENYNGWHRFWKSYDSINPSGNDGETKTNEDKTYGGTYNIWGKFNKYIFNREVITYSDGTKDTIDAHFLAVWEDGIKDMVDYYCLDSVDDGNAPAMKNDIPITTPPSENPQPGKNYWVLGTSIPKMDKDWPVLWNVTKKTYLNPAGNEDLVTWTTPLVLGVFGEGENGQDSIYADLDNEMDTVQIDSNKHVIRTGKYSTILHMYQGSEQIKIHKITISGEDSSSNPLANKMTLYYKNESGTYTEFKETDNINSNKQLNTDEIKIVIELKAPTNTIDEYNKLIFTVTHSNNADIIRRTSYTLIGSKNPSVFSIVPSDNVLVERIEGNSTIISPNQITLKVVEQIGNKKVEHSHDVSGDGGFQLWMTKNEEIDSPIILGNNYTVSTMSGSTCLFQAGDKLTFTVHVDTPNTSGGDSDTDPDIVMDTETIFVLKEGSVGPKGDAGNGYRYYYARYVNESKPLYSGATIAELSSDDSTLNEPIFLLNGVSLPGSSSAQGADGLHTYEYRTEKFFDGSNWSNWSKPITIAKYLTADNISTEVSNAVTNATTAINNNLNTAVNRLDKLEGYIDPSTGIFSGKIADSTKAAILSGYATKDDVSGAISSINLGGLLVGGSGTETFSEWYNSQNSTLTDVTQRMSAAEGILDTAVTTTQLSDVTTAFDNFKADAHDKFAQMDRTVANAQFMTDAEGYLMVDIPVYSIWFNDEAGLSGAYKDPDTRNDVTWVLASILEGSDGSDSDSEIDPDSIQSFNTLVPYIIPESKLYNTNTDNVVFVLKTVIDNIDIVSQLDEIKNIIDREIIVTLNKLTGKYTIDYADSGSESESESDISIIAGIYTYDEEIPGYSPDKVLVIMYATAKVSDGKDGIFSNLSWTVGVAEGQIGVSAVQGGGINRFSYVNTASLFNEPKIPFYGTEIKEKLERIQYMTSLNQQYGYGVTNISEGTNGDDYNEHGELNTNGKLSITGYDGYNYKLIPENESVENIIKFIKTSNLDTAIPNDDEIGIGKSKTYYVAANKGSSVSNNSDNSYTISLPGNNNVEFIKPYNEPMFKNKHMFNEVESKGFTVTDDGFRQTTTKDASYDYYDMYITSKYDEVKISYEYNITPGNPSPDNEHPNNLTGLYLLYWYEGDKEPILENWTMYNPVPIFETYNLADSVDPEDPVNPDDSTANNKPSGHGEESIFKHIELQEDKILHMKVFTDCGTDLTSVDIKYKLETSNRITYGNAFKDKKISISNITEVDSTNTEVDSTNIEESSKLIILNSKPESNKCSYTFNYSKSTISVTTFTSYLQNIDLRLKLEWNDTFGGGNPDYFYYMVIPGSYNAKTLQSLSKAFNEYTGSDDYLLKGEFLNNPNFNTVGRVWETLDNRSDGLMYDFTPIDLEFNKVEANLDKSGFSYTIIQYYPNQDGVAYEFTSTMTADVISEMPWDTKNGYSRSPYGSSPKYLIDKIKVTVNDRARIGELLTMDDRARDKYGSNNPGVKNYIEVLDADRPYLTVAVSELATISQMVSKGIASTSIITKAGETTAVFYAQAVDGGDSQIYMNANDVGIESDYFTLNKKGLTLTGNLYAKDKNKNITAGVIGDSSPIGDDGVKFFAGINLPSTYSDSEIKNNLKKAKFYVTESGFLYAENAKISGNITANNFSASTTYDRYEGETFLYSVKKTSIMDEEKFEVTSEFSQGDLTQTAKIYISVLDKINAISGDLHDTEGTELINVPTLCMEYNNHKYYLTPDMWKSLAPKTYFDVKINVENSYYKISVENFNGDFYVGWKLWIAEITNPDNYWEIKAYNSSIPIRYSNYTGDITGYFGDTAVGVDNTIPSSLLGKKVKVYLSLLTPFEDPINYPYDLPTASQDIDIPYKSDKGVNTVNVTSWTFTYTKAYGWVITGPGSSN